MMRVDAKPTPICLVQNCLPTCEADDDGVIAVYVEIYNTANNGRKGESSP